MAFDQRDEDLESTTTEAQRLSSFKQQSLRRNQVKWAKRECARRLAIDSTGLGRPLNIRRGPADIASKSGRRGWCAWTVLGVFASTKAVRVRVRDAPIGVIDHGVELDAYVVGLLAHINLLD
jgi:hypothetical protein